MNFDSFIGMISDIIVASGFFTLIRCWHFKLTSIQMSVLMSTSSFDSYWYLHELLSPTYTPFYSKIIPRYHYWYQKIRSESSCRRFCFIVTQKCCYEENDGLSEFWQNCFGLEDWSRIDKFISWSLFSPSTGWSCLAWWATVSRITY